MPTDNSKDYVEFTSDHVYQTMKHYFSGLPELEFWNKENSLELARKIIAYLFKKENMDNPGIWVKFDFLLQAAFEDPEFFKHGKQAFGEFIGSEKFAEEILEKVKSGELIWRHECVVLMDRMDQIHKRQVKTR